MDAISRIVQIHEEPYCLRAFPISDPHVRWAVQWRKNKYIKASNIYFTLGKTVKWGEPYRESYCLTSVMWSCLSHWWDYSIVSVKSRTSSSLRFDEHSVTNSVVSLIRTTSVDCRWWLFSKRKDWLPQGDSRTISKQFNTISGLFSHYSSSNFSFWFRFWRKIKQRKISGRDQFGFGEIFMLFHR